MGPRIAVCALLCACGSSMPAPREEPPPRDAAMRDAARPVEVGRPDAAEPEDSAVAMEEPNPALPAPETFDAGWWESAVIYFVMTDRFVNGDPDNDGGAPCTDRESTTLFHGGDFRGLEASLDYLQELGANVVWITPVPAQIGLHGDQCGYHGYWADLDDPNDAAIEPRLGTAGDLDSLIAALHARGMRLMIDHVVNHAGYDSRITRTHPEWFHPGHPACESLGDPTVTCGLGRLPDFAQEREDVASYLDDLSASFMRRFAFDAIRMDTVKHVAPEYFADRFIPAVTRERPGLYLLGELFDEGSYDPHAPYLDAGFHGLFDFPLRRALITSLAQHGSLDAVASRISENVARFGIERARLRSTFLDNHDVPRFATELTGEEPGRSDRYRLALGVLFTAPGIPQLTYGAELGMIGAYPDNRRDMPAWAFDVDSRAEPREGYLPEPGGTFAWTQQLATLRREVPALSHGDYVELWQPGGSGSNVLAFLRSAGESRALVVINGGDAIVQSLAIPLRTNPHVDGAARAAFRDGVTLVQRLGEGAARVAEGRLIVTLPARRVSVWTL